MNYINGISLDELIRDLTTLYDLTNKTENLKHYAEKIKENIKLFQSINKNTIYNKMYVDAYAFIDACERFGSPFEFGSPFDQILITEPKNKKENAKLRIHYSNYAMNGYGYYVGYENIVFVTDCIKKSDLDLSGIPYMLSEYVIDPFKFEIESKDCPPEETPTFDSHDKNCKVHRYRWNPEKNPYPDYCDCGCNENFEGYYPPDDDFFYLEINHLIHLILEDKHYIPEAIFDSEKREWSIGNQVIYTIE